MSKGLYFIAHNSTQDTLWTCLYILNLCVSQKDAYKQDNLEKAIQNQTALNSKHLIIELNNAKIKNTNNIVNYKK